MSTPADIINVLTWPRGHHFTLVEDSAPCYGVRTTCSCGYEERHQVSLAQVFGTIKEHIGE